MYATGWGLLRSAGTGEGEPVDIPFFSQNTSRKELGRRGKFGANQSSRFGTYSKDTNIQTHNFRNIYDIYVVALATSTLIPSHNIHMHNLPNNYDYLISFYPGS